MAELESRQKGFSVGYILSTNSNTRAEMKSRLDAVTAKLGTDWDFEPDGATDEEIKANYMMLSSADAAYHALLRDEGGMTFNVAGIAPGHGGKDILKHDIINDITELWNANCPSAKYKKVALDGFYLNTDEVITKGIV